jgi:hypothetical protein
MRQVKLQSVVPQYLSLAPRGAQRLSLPGCIEIFVEQDLASSQAYCDRATICEGYPKYQNLLAFCDQFVKYCPGLIIRTLGETLLRVSLANQA